MRGGWVVGSRPRGLGMAGRTGEAGFETCRRMGDDDHDDDGPIIGRRAGEETISRDAVRSALMGRWRELGRSVGDAWSRVRAWHAYGQYGNPRKAVFLNNTNSNPKQVHCI